MEQANQELVIILPESMENMPVRIIRDEATEELTVQVVTLPTPDDSPPSTDKRHTAIWHQNQYENIPLNDILWVEANGSYCHVHITRNRKFLLSFPLSQIQKALPKDTFIRVHRSFLVNINQIRSISGNCVVIENQYIKIGKEYRKEVLDQFIFLGVRNMPKEQGNNK